MCVFKKNIERNFCLAITYKEDTSEYSKFRAEYMFIMNFRKKSRPPMIQRVHPSVDMY